jgi:hypothetical protein
LIGWKLTDCTLPLPFIFLHTWNFNTFKDDDDSDDNDDDDDDDNNKREAGDEEDEPAEQPKRKKVKYVAEDYEEIDTSNIIVGGRGARRGASRPAPRPAAKPADPANLGKRIVVEESEEEAEF